MPRHKTMFRRELGVISDSLQIWEVLDQQILQRRMETFVKKVGDFCKVVHKGLYSFHLQFGLEILSISKFSQEDLGQCEVDSIYDYSVELKDFGMFL